MIQRIQSIFLLLVAAVMIVTLFFPFWQEMNLDGDEVVRINAFQLVYANVSELTGEEVISTKPTWYISALAILAAGVAIFSVFQYKNRLTQMKLGALNSLIMGANVGLVYYFSAYKGEPVIPNHAGIYLIGFYLLAAGMFFNLLANRFIKKDEKLVRSADRIR